MSGPSSITRSLTAERATVRLGQAMDRRLARQELLASNLANSDTPGYQPVDMEFEGALAQALVRPDPDQPPGLARTEGAHMASVAEELELRDTVVLRPDVSDRLDGNGVDPDRELVRFADNAARYRATVELARRRYALVNGVVQTMGA